jgi:tRNA G18 (ribose-2'-O)-methylase SpoU
MIKLNAKQLRTSIVDATERTHLVRQPIYIICDNILDTYNVGSIFRLADALAVTKVFLCGVTETPPNTRIKKASINTTEWVEWEYVATTEEVIERLRSQVADIQIVLVEQDDRSVPFGTAPYKSPLALIVSNETQGATDSVRSLADMIVELPMYGVNKSLNVMVSLGIVLYTAAEILSRQEKKK